MSLPIPQFRLIARKDYKVTLLRVVSLCVVETFAGRQIRLYRWWRREGTDPWKVALANVSVHDLDLDRIARDALTLANEHNVHLNWRGDQASDSATDLDALVEDEPVGHGNAEPPGAEHSLEPECPRCGSNGEVVPVLYGVFDPASQSSGTDNVAFGGLTFSADSPLWHCKSCGERWGKVAWRKEPVTQSGDVDTTFGLSDDDIPF